MAVEDSVSNWAEGVPIEVPGVYNCLVGLTSTTTFLDLEIRIGPVRVVDGAMCAVSSPVALLRHFSESGSVHQVTIKATTTVAGTIQLVFGQYRAPGGTHGKW